MNILCAVLSFARSRGLRLAAILLTSGLTGHAKKKGRSPELVEAIRQAREIIAKDANKVPGLSVALSYNGKIAWSEGFGFSDLEKKRSVSPSKTRFRIASISKSLTGVGLMRLVEQGHLDLDAPVQKYVPDFPDKEQGVITTRLLAGHLAGIRHYKGLEGARNESFASVSAGLIIFKNDPLVATPGSEFHYSTYGYSLISAAMESAANRDFLTYMRVELFTPLGMSQTRPDYAEAIDEDRTRFYKGSVDGGFSPAHQIDSSYKWAGGGFLSTAEDLATFGSALLQPGFLSEDSLSQIFTPQKAKEGKPSSYGIGWGIANNRLGRTFYFHTGGQQGASTFLFVRPEANVVLAVLCNLSNARLRSRADLQLMAKCFDGLTGTSN